MALNINPHHRDTSQPINTFATDDEYIRQAHD